MSCCRLTPTVRFHVLGRAVGAAMGYADLVRRRRGTSMASRQAQHVSRRWAHATVRKKHEAPRMPAGPRRKVGLGLVQSAASAIERRAMVLLHVVFDVFGDDVGMAGEDMVAAGEDAVVHAARPSGY